MEKHELLILFIPFKPSGCSRAESLSLFHAVRVYSTRKTYCKVVLLTLTAAVAGLCYNNTLNEEKDLGQGTNRGP